MRTSRALVVALVAAGGGVAAADATALYTTDVEVKLSGGRSTLTARYPRVIAPTPLLTAEINDEIARSARAIGALPGLASDGDPFAFDSSCSLDVATDRFVAWTCSYGGAGGPNTGGSFEERSRESYYVDGNTLRRTTLANVFAPRKDLLAQLAKLAGNCEIDTAPSLYADLEGVLLGGGDDDRGCRIAWEPLEPLLAKDNPTERSWGGGPDHKPSRPSWKGTPPRFVATAEGSVKDAYTGLEWAAKDNGADIAWAAAAAWATAYRGGGHSDWRLPTDAELEVLAEPALAHKEKGDCTKGKLAVVVTELLHPSCGLAWSATKIGAKGAVAFGLISGSSRVSKLTDKKNHRALVVRDVVKAAK